MQPTVRAAENTTAMARADRMVGATPVSQRNEAEHATEFWEALRRFLRRNEHVARKHGLTPQRHQLLVMSRAP